MRSGLNLLLVVVVAAALAASCAGPVEDEPFLCQETLSEGGQPSAGWTSTTLWESDSPVWSVFVDDILPGKAGREIVAMDDKGRATLLFMNNNESVPWTILMDGLWLGAAAFGDIEPEISGKELYLAGSRGNLYQVVPLGQGGFESRVIWYARDEIHSLILGDVVPANPGPDLLACTLRGEICLLTPRRAGGPWKVDLLYREPARVRDAVVYDFCPELEGDEIVYVSRAGRLVRLGWKDGNLDVQVLYSDSQGLARIALGLVRENGVPVIYTAGDDGRIIRFSRSSVGAWIGTPIFEGLPGARGVAPVRIDDEACEECVALFGYAKEVTLLKRRKGEERFSVETVFTDTDKGHWLEAAALDGRTGADEIVVCGYSGNVTLLSREEEADPLPDQ